MSWNRKCVIAKKEGRVKSKVKWMGLASTEFEAYLGVCQGHPKLIVMNIHLPRHPSLPESLNGSVLGAI